jgi:tetratricopeptide (TPR) repeat protein
MRNVQLAWMPRTILPFLLLLVGGCAGQQDNVKKLRTGYDALSARQFDAAMTAADEVLASSPKETLPAEAHYLRGRVFEERAVGGQAVSANLQNARSEYVTAMRLAHTPDLAGRIEAGAANVAFHQDDYATALEQWKAAFERLDKAEDKVLTLYRLGQTSQRLGQWDEADHYFAAVQEAAPGTDLANEARAKAGARGFVVQLATFADAKQADAAVADLKKQGVNAQHLMDAKNRSLHVVRVGPMGYAEAKQVKARFAAVYPNAVIMP